MRMESELILSRGGFPALSARGCIQHITPIEGGNLRRTINGKLVYTGRVEGHKYRSVIKCEDKACIALEGIWRGGPVRVGCIQRLGQKVTHYRTMLERDPVEGSIIVMNSKQEAVEPLSREARQIILPENVLNQSMEIYITYRPWLDMCVTDFSFMTNEWGLKTGWHLELEEI
jgi:hypothetical protein